MADTANFAEMIVPKKERTRKALKPKNEVNTLTSEPNMADQIVPAAEESAGKENDERLSKPKRKTKGSSKLKQHSDLSTIKDSSILTSDPTPTAPEESVGKETVAILSEPKTKTKGTGKTKKQGNKSFEMELQEMQEKLEQLRLEKEQTQGLLKEREETLKLKEEELENRGREQEKLQLELKKLQKLKEFKPSMTFPLVPSSKENEQDKKEKKKKGSSETKRPSPPYFLWVKDQWNEVKKQNPEAEFKEISSILGAKWKTISAEEKKPYEEKYQAEKEGYLKIIGNEKRENEAMRLLEEEHKQKTAMELLEQYLQFKQETEKEKKPKKEKDPLKPKHPMSAFFVFLSERRTTLVAENKNVSEVAKIAGEEWKNMSEEQKVPYEEVAKKKKEQYVQDMAIYKQRKEDETESLKMVEEEMMKIQKQEALRLLKKKEKTDNIIKKTKEKSQKKQKEEKKNADPNKPKRPPSSFILYSKEARKDLMEERPGVNNSTLSALIAVKWKEMNEEEKQGWNKRAAEYMETYKKEMEEYNNKSSAKQEATSSGVQKN